LTDIDYDPDFMRRA